MSDFLDSDFLLQSPVSRMLYREHAASKPIIDYHCHLDPALIAADRRFASITALWLGGDHYKWRAMRANGVNERFITGDASDWEKFYMNHTKKEAVTTQGISPRQTAHKQ